MDFVRERGWGVIGAGNDERDVFYARFDDDRPVRVLAWKEVAALSVQREVYMLMYTRRRLWRQDVRDGTENTPYRRGRDSLEIAGLALNAEQDSCAADVAVCESANDAAVSAESGGFSFTVRGALWCVRTTFQELRSRCQVIVMYLRDRCIELRKHPFV
jgi:hypothetical protein